jgi:hypothetical protein
MKKPLSSKQITTTQKKILSTEQMLKIKGGNGDSNPPVDPNEIVIDDIING